MATRTIAPLLNLLLLITHLTSASPFSLDLNPRNTKRTAATPDLSSLTLPTSTLPPPTGLVLKHVALGVGTQNYTCTADNATATPGSFGALASLYDIGPFLASPLGPLFQNALPPLALAMYGALSADDHSAVMSTLAAQMPAAGQAVLSATAFGEHFFADVAATLTPTWALTPSAAMYPADPVAILFQGKKTATAAAPPDACPGLQAEGAVDWLYLTEASSSAPDYSAVYRVVTAGGMQPDTCATVSVAEIEVKYAAEYWFYGPE